MVNITNIDDQAASQSGDVVMVMVKNSAYTGPLPYNVAQHNITYIDDRAASQSHIVCVVVARGTEFRCSADLFAI